MSEKNEIMTKIETSIAGILVINNLNIGMIINFFFYYFLLKNIFLNNI